MVSGLILKRTIPWFSCMPLGIALIFTAGMTFRAIASTGFVQNLNTLDPVQLVCEYVPPNTGSVPEGDGSGSRT